MNKYFVSIALIMCFANVDRCNSNVVNTKPETIPQNLKSPTVGQKGESCEKGKYCDKNLLCIQGFCQEDGSSAEEPIPGLQN